MDTETRLKAANDLLAPWAAATNTPEPDRLDINVDAANLIDAVKALRQPAEGEPWGYLSAITGLDTLGNPENPQAGELEALYHFCSGSAVVTLRVKSARQEASVPSICKIIPSASLYERELSEMFGFNVVNTPNPARLFLPDDWPDGLYPLRKEPAITDARTGHWPPPDDGPLFIYRCCGADADHRLYRTLARKTGRG